MDQKFPTVLRKCQKMLACISADGGHFEHMETLSKLQTIGLKFVIQRRWKRVIST